MTEYGHGDMFQLGEVSGKANIYFINTYFRDANRFTNGWNTALFARGTNGEAIDTVWIENCTASNPGLTFFGKLNPIRFFFFDHNTIVNVAKYVFFFEQYEEAYFTNNLFINCNWEGECQSTYETQIQSQQDVKSGPAGVTNIMRINQDIWELGHGYAPAMEDVKFLSSNNLHFTSPFLQSYYNGEFNSVADYPLSSRTWSADIGEDDIPIQVENVPPRFLNDLTKQLIEEFPGIMAEGNYDNTKDPEMFTKGIASQEVGDEFAKWGRNNYGVAGEGETFDNVLIAFGDQDPTTVPGVETENGQGFADVMDLIENFSYQSDVRSTIDGRPLGSLAWWPDELQNYDGEAALANVVSYYEELLTSTAVEDEFPSEYNLENYPNPFNSSTVIHFTIAKSSKVKVVVYDSVGKNIELLANGTMHAGAHRMYWDASAHSAGLYYYTISIDDNSTSRKLILLK